VGSFLEPARSGAPVGKAIAGARRTGRLFGALRWVGFFREASGPGWVLTGDAGHFKDPGPGRGIGDAFLQAEHLAPAIVAGLDGDVDAAMARWGRWRDDEFAEHYWFAGDTSAAGPPPAVPTELLRGLFRRGDIGRFLDVLNHRARPSQVATPPRLMGAVARTVAGHPGERLNVLREVRDLGLQELRRRRLNRRPEYDTSSTDAGATEVEDDAVATSETR
jgi:hypothetical protein